MTPAAQTIDSASAFFLVYQVLALSEQFTLQTTSFYTPSKGERCRTR